MKLPDHVLPQIALLSREHGAIELSPLVPTETMRVPMLFDDDSDRILSLRASGDFGDLFCYEILGDGFVLRYSEGKIKEEMNLTVVKEGPMLSVQFNMRNSLRHIMQGFPYQFPLVPVLKHQYNMVFVPYIHTDYELLEGGEYSCITIHYEPSYLERYLDIAPPLMDFIEKAYNNEPAAMNLTYLWSTPEIRAILHSILFCTFTEPMKRFYLEAKVHELMLLSFLNAMPEESYRPTVTLKEADLDKLQQAREYLTHNLDNPGTLLDLAHNIGLNDFKLKQGFKQLYGTTVFGFLHEERMQKANMLLRDTSMSIHEISMMTGYKNLSNFTAAFKKRFGFPPSAIGNRR